MALLDPEYDFGRDCFGEAFVPATGSQSKEDIVELAEKWLDSHPWARRAADEHRKEAQQRQSQTVMASMSAGHRQQTKLGRFSAIVAGKAPERTAAVMRTSPCRPSIDSESRAPMVAPRPPRKPVPAVKESVRAKLLAIVVAPHLTTLPQAEELKRCLESIAAQTVLPTALWVCWHAEDFGVKLAVSHLLDELMPRCSRRGTPLTQMQLDEPVGRWKNVEAVLKARQRMGGDVCDMWVAVAQPDELWHPRRCECICQEAASASGNASILLLKKGLEIGQDSGDPSAAQVDELLQKGMLSLLSDDDVQFVPSAVLMRVPALAKFLASLSADMLRHDLCDLAFCSYSWNNPAASMADLDIPWSFCSRSPDVAARLAEFALRVMEGEAFDASLEERQSALAMRRSAGNWAYAISAADFVRFVTACKWGAEGLCLLRTFRAEDDPWMGAIRRSLWQKIASAWQVSEDGCDWLERQTSPLLRHAEAALGMFAEEPSPERLAQLLRVTKLSDSRNQT